MSKEEEAINNLLLMKKFEENEMYYENRGLLSTKIELKNNLKN
jgi:hypothetical protein